MIVTMQQPSACAHQLFNWAQLCGRLMYLHMDTTSCISAQIVQPSPTPFNPIASLDSTLGVRPSLAPLLVHGATLILSRTGLLDSGWNARCGSPIKNILMIGR